MTLHYYNFSHDIQLAAGSSVVNLSSNVRALEHDLQPLACWLAHTGDQVVVSSDLLDDCGSFYAGTCAPRVEFVPHHSLPSSCDILPWGWDEGIVARLQRDAVDKKAMAIHLPDKSMLNTIRQLSSRSQVSVCLDALRQLLPEAPLCGQSVFCMSMEEVLQAISRFNGRAVLKAPWSSSGRGIRFLLGQDESAAMLWVDRLLRRKEGVEVQEYCVKRNDWAMEFFVDTSGHVSFTGMSLFFTSPLSAYSGNVLASQEVLQGKWEEELPLSLLYDVRRAWEILLSHWLKGKYTGPLGVDMMTCSAMDGSVMLHPCVEINLRHTMGQLAVRLSDLFPALPEARLLIRSSGAVSCEQLNWIPLTPRLPSTRFSACIVWG